MVRREGQMAQQHRSNSDAAVLEESDGSALSRCVLFRENAVVLKMDEVGKPNKSVIRTYRPKKWTGSLGVRSQAVAGVGRAWVSETTSGAVWTGGSGEVFL